MPSVAWDDGLQQVMYRTPVGNLELVFALAFSWFINLSGFLMGILELAWSLQPSRKMNTRLPPVRSSN